VQNFLGLARQSPPERRRLSVNQAVHEALELLAYSLRVADVETSLQLDPTLPAIWGDAHQIHQVVVNLLTNARHAVRSAAGDRRIHITTARVDERRVRLTIEDSGPGIPDAVRARMFEPFFTTKPAGEGTGLGLSLCRGIVESHEGRIEASSSSMLGGARFVVDLVVGMPPALQNESSHRPAEPAPVRPRRILVVDDETVLAQLIADALRSAGHTADIAHDGIEALESVHARAYDVVVTDVRMPRLDGINLYRALSGIDAARRPTCIFMTGDGLNSETAQFLARPGRLSLEKPFRSDELLQLLSKTQPYPVVA
jgi:CheY-like chemotaxis protein